MTYGSSNDILGIIFLCTVIDSDTVVDFPSIFFFFFFFFVIMMCKINCCIVSPEAIFSFVYANELICIQVSYLRKQNLKFLT